MDNRTQANIYEYSDYRQYLSDFYTAKKSVNPGYSHRVFAKQAGLSSPSHLLMIIKGERNLSIKTIEKFAEGMHLSAKEKKYFELMVLFNQTNDLQRKAKYFAEIMALKMSTKKLHSLEKEKFDFLSKWYVVAVYVLIDIKNFNPDPQWISKRLGGKISVSQANEALENLLKLGIITVDPKRGYKQSYGAITVPDDTRSIAVYNYHQSMIRLASEALRTIPPELREMNGATITIPKNKLTEIKEKIRAFRKEINQLASSYDNPDEVFQLNIQLFPLTAMEEK
ncbi:MAG: TIGR02147 family protein [Bdellovibrio sp.]